MRAGSETKLNSVGISGMKMLDSDVIIDLLRGYAPAVQWFAALPSDEVLLVSGYVAMELIQGCRNKSELLRVQRQLGAYDVAWLSPRACGAALEVFAEYRLSHNAGLLDVLIGQTAVTLAVPLHTFNQKHYTFIPGIETVQPYVRGE